MYLIENQKMKKNSYVLKRKTHLKDADQMGLGKQFLNNTYYAKKRLVKTIVNNKKTEDIKTVSN